MRDAIVRSVQDTYSKIHFKHLPRGIAEIFADDILKAINPTGVFGSVGKTVEYKKTIKETLGQAMDRSEQKMQAENVKPQPNCGPRNTIGVVPPRKLHRACSCGSQFQVFQHESIKDIWIFICNNESTFCEIVSTRVRAATEDGAWAIWDRGLTLNTEGYYGYPETLEDRGQIYGE